MALDGLYLSCLRREIAATLRDARIDKVFQPSREEVVLAFRGREGTHKLYISARVNSPRIHFTDIRLENPAQPPMFCMLLRKRLTGGRFAAVRQNGLERALYLDFDCVNELGDMVRLTLAAEIMGKHSNIILIDGDGRVVDAAKRVDLTMSAVRPLLPGVAYAVPPVTAPRLDVGTAPATDIADAALSTGKPLAAALLAVTQGISPLLCRESAVCATGDTDTLPTAVTAAMREKMVGYLQHLQDIAHEKADGVPFLVTKTDGVPLEYSCLPILQYGLAAVGAEKSGFSAVLDEFYARRDAAERLRQKKADITHLLAVNRERIARKLSRQRQELAACGEREQNRMFADLINANIHAIPRGAASAELINYFDPACATVKVPLDASLSAAANAQRYYKLYRKAQTAERMLSEQIVKGEAELAYLETVEDALSRAADTAEIGALRQ